MQKEKKMLIAVSSALCLVVLLVLFVPYEKVQYKDGTTEWTSLTYKVVKWHRAEWGPIIGERQEAVMHDYTKVYWFPDNFKLVADLWEAEIAE